MYKYLLPFLLSFIFLPGLVQAQELQCNVTVDVTLTEEEQATSVDRQLTSEMRNAIFDFMNTRRWTNDVYTLEERIKCQIFITITGVPEIGRYKANVQIVSSRPVYGTGFETTLFSYIDKDWVFNFNQSQPLQYSETSYTSELASLLSFYAYMIIGMDNDSFAPLGGSSAYDRAVNIMNNTIAQPQPGPGWKAFESNRNRYWLVTNLQDPQMEPLRRAIYEYHRLGLDNFVTQPEQARQAIVQALEKVQRVAQLKPGAAILRSFFETKADEIVNIFKMATPSQKQAVYTTMTAIDPTNNTKYQAILRP